MRFSSWVSTAVVASSLCFAPTSRAQMPERRGLYVQSSAGLGLAHFWGSEFDSDGEVTATSNGLSLAGALLIGGAIRRGLVLGGGALGALSFNSKPELELNGRPLEREHLGAYGDAFVLAGPFVDYFPLVSSGFHVQALGGFAHHGYGAENGYGFMGGAGYEWIKNQWSSGWLARLTFTRCVPNATPWDSALNSKRDFMLALSLEASFTYH